MTEQDIKETVYKVLKNIAPDTQPEKLGPDENIRKSLMIDSFDYLQFIVGLDEQFGIQTPEDDYSKIGTLKELTAYILTQKNKTTASTLP